MIAEDGAILRLRPIVYASPLPDGFHVRGATSSFTVAGGAGLWQLWRAMDTALAGGATVERLRRLSDDPRVRAAIDAIFARLCEHDMLVRVPAGWDASGPGAPPERLARWLEAAAPDPAQAWARLAAADWTVTGAGAPAAAARRALSDIGLRATGSGEIGGSDALLEAAGRAVGLIAGPRVAYVTPVSTVEAVRGDMAAVRPQAAADGTVPVVLAALVGGAAVHRLVCAVAGLPDPARPASDLSPVRKGLAGDWPGMLVARLDPLRAEYHPWLTGHADPRSPAARSTLESALAAVDALCDAELGVLPAADLATPPQIPAGLAACTSGTAAVYGIGVNAATARLGAVTGLAARLISAQDGTPVAVGADRRHANGILLRRLVSDWAARTSHDPVDEATWSASPQARLWWKTVTLRFGVPARMRVTRLRGGIFHGEVRHGTAVLGTAVESAAADAAAFAALCAAGTLQWRQSGGDHTAVPAQPCGALPVAESVGDGRVAWQTGDWIWPADLDAREERLQADMADLLGESCIGAPDMAGTTRGGLLAALDAVGFAVVTRAPRRSLSMPEPVALAVAP